MNHKSQYDSLRVLAFIERHSREYGYPPSQWQICEHMGYAGIRAAQYRIEGLEGHGLLTRVPKAARSMRVTQEGMFALAEAAL